MPLIAIAALFPAVCAARPPRQLPPAGELVLDADHPVIDAMMAGQPVRLRVDLGQWEAIELNAAMPLPPGATEDRDMQIGRVLLTGRTAQTVLEIAGRKLPVLAAQHGRTAADDADGVIGPDILPYAEIRWHRNGAPPPTGEIVLPLDLTERTGLTAVPPGLPLPIRLRFSLQRPASEATAAAGSFLAQRFGGRFVGPSAPLPVLFGITRPARPLRIERPPLLAGFRFGTIPVRIADFRGDNPLPSDPGTAGEIVVARRDRPQPAESWVTLARDRLAACADITYRAAPRTLTLACAFDR